MLLTEDEQRTSPWLEAALERFERDNAELVAQTRDFLDGLVVDRPRHARFINTLSLLEHLGSHKIMATQHGAAVDQPTLKHLAEEAHHAFFMKRQAEKTAERPLEYVREDLLAPAAARMYFQRLESAMVRRLGPQRSARAAYLYMSMIVEFRALWFYKLYQETLQRVRHPLSLKRVLGEEQHHLGDMAQRLEEAGELDDAHTAVFLEREKALYGRLLTALQRAAA
jgi:hypothetical protein